MSLWYLILFWDVQKAEKAAIETNRAVVVASNVEIRRTKTRLMEEIPKLRKLAQRKVKSNLCLLIFKFRNLT